MLLRLIYFLLFLMLPFARCDPDPPHIKLQEPPDRMGISQELLDNFRRYAEWAAAAYREDNNKEIVSHRDPEMKTWLKCQSEAACEFIDQEHAEITWNTGDHKTHLVAFIAVPKVRQEIIVAFRGTCGIENWFRNFNFHPRRIDWCDHCRGHSGWFEGWWDLRNDLTKGPGGLFEQMRRHPQRRIILVGHSLGAAMATIAAADLRMHPELELTTFFNGTQQLRNETIDVYAYGSPRIGNNYLAEWLSYYQPGQNFRMTEPHDPFVRMPGHDLHYNHLSPEYHFIGNDSDPKKEDFKILWGINNDEGAEDDSMDFGAHATYFKKLSGCDQ